MDYILGIDIGTGSTKAVALNLSYETLEVCQEYYPTSAPRPGYSEQDPGLIWDAFISCLQGMEKQLGSAPVAIGLSSAMHSLIAVDKSGTHLAPMITWADQRSAAIAAAIKDSPAGMELYRNTGTPIHAMSPLCKLIWMTEHNPELVAQTHKFISIKEYIWHRLFGEFKIDHSIASCTGLFDIVALKWHMPALERAGVRKEQLSEPVETDYSKKGDKLKLAGLSGFKKTVFVVGASDGCAANLGSHANQPGTAALTVGTSGAIRICSAKPIYSGKAMTFNYLLDKQTYICGGPVNNGGLALQWLLKNVLGKTELNDEDYQSVFDSAATVTAGSKGLIFLPYLSGERAPIWDPSSSGAFIGLRLDHGHDELCRAVLEGICYALNDVLLVVERASGPISQLHVSGGFVHSRMWMQLLADITGKKVVLLQTEDASAVGAAYLAAANVLPEIGRPVSSAEDHLAPNPIHHQEYLRMFGIYQQLYGSLHEVMHQLQPKNS
ncbi:gluconokinase [Pedobacter sp. BAL39]|uniref:gluconokinase n=1 Tax=Pedobacter sp. BAL39 TaxID=391596 RepID=UPI000155A3A0|nr:gluconokinase [Pedobacter sp. BAL39]EDM34490.1 gluconokinase [Pedobacter sp. BAL39]